MITLCCGRPASGQAALIKMLAPLLLFLACSAAADNDARTKEFEFDIPRTSRVMALHELSRQAGGLLLGYMSGGDQEERTLVGPIKGRFTVEAALRVLLRSSTLSYRWVDGNMISVEPGPTGQADTALQANDLGGTVPRSTDLDLPEVSVPEEVLVLGWPIRDLALAVSPVVVVDRGDLDAIGAPSLPEALRHLSQSVFMRPEGYRTSGAQYAEMRGLGPDAALVLINGRRTLPSATSIAASAFDLNSLPITAVERIELVLDSASAAYGMDATGGIINIVLRDKVTRPELVGRYGAAEGGAIRQRLTFSGGINQDKRHGMLVLDYYEVGGLIGDERALWRDQDYRRFGGRDHRSLTSDPGNITAVRGNLPGLPAPVASVPLIDTTPGVSIEDFFATAGQPTRESLLRHSSVVPESRRLSLIASAAAELAERLAVSSEVLYVNRKSAYRFAPPVMFSMPVPATNAFNPFGTTVLAHRLLSEFPPQYQAIESDLLRSVVALRGGLGAWNWEASALYSKEEATAWVGNLLDLQGSVMNALSSSDAATALNPFAPGPMGSPDLLSSLFAVRDEDDYAAEGKQLAGFIQGPLLRLPAGRVTTVLGGEWRNESLTSADEGAAALDRSRDVVAGFIQLRVPLVSESMQLPWLHELTFSAGSRWDRYSDVDDVARSHLGLVWKPLRSLSVHASGSGSYRPPSLYDLYLPQLSTVARVSDPRRNELANVTLTIGGNEALRPSTARSYTAGVLFTPDSAMNWKISADYWRIDVRNRVLALPPQLLLANEEQFADRIERDASGALRSVDASRTDVGGVKLAGIDLGVKADFQTHAGRFTPELSVTWFDTFKSQDIPDGPTLERVDVASQFGTILEWRAIFSLRWNRGPYGASASARYTPSYDDAIAGVRVGRRVASQTLFDLHASLDLGRLQPKSSIWDGVKLWVGASNLFDEEPSFAEVGDAAGFDLSQGDLKQRSLYIRIDKTF